MSGAPGKTRGSPRRPGPEFRGSCGRRASERGQEPREERTARRARSPAPRALRRERTAGAQRCDPEGPRPWGRPSRHPCAPADGEATAGPSAPGQARARVAGSALRATRGAGFLTAGDGSPRVGSAGRTRGGTGRCFARELARSAEKGQARPALSASGRLVSSVGEPLPPRHLHLSTQSDWAAQY